MTHTDSGGVRVWWDVFQIHPEHFLHIVGRSRERLALKGLSSFVHADNLQGSSALAGKQLFKGLGLHATSPFDGLGEREVEIRCFPETVQPRRETGNLSE